MFIGTFEHNIDGKNRVFIPSDFRAELGPTFICKLCVSKHPSIQVYKQEDYQKMSQVSVIGRQHPEKVRDALAANFLVAGETTCDSHGRISLNPFLTKKAKIEGKCIFIGFGDYIEIMSPEVYEEYLEKIYEDSLLDAQSFVQEAEVYREKTANGEFLGSDVIDV